MRHEFTEGPEPRLAFNQVMAGPPSQGDGAAAFERTCRRDSELPKHFALAFVQFSRQLVDDAESADSCAVTELDGCARIETDVRLPCHPWVVGEARILRGVWYFEQFIAQHSVDTEGEVSRDRRDVRHSNIGLDPLPVGVDQADERDGHGADESRGANQRVEFSFRITAEHVGRTQRGQAGFFFITMIGNGHLVLPV